MPRTPEDRAREAIDAALRAAGWDVQDADAVNLHVGRGVAIREFRLKTGHGSADYLLYVDRKAAGVIEAKKMGDTLTGVEPQTGKYSTGMPAHLPRACDPLPFLYQSTGDEIRFTNLPGAAARVVELQLAAREEPEERRKGGAYQASSPSKRVAPSPPGVSPDPRGARSDADGVLSVAYTCKTSPPSEAAVARRRTQGRASILVSCSIKP